MTSQAQTAEAPPAEAPPAEARAPEDAPDGPAPSPRPAPRDDREAMLAEQMAACHQVVLDCLARATRAGDAEAARHGELRLAARFMTLFLRQSGALDRHRDHLRRAREADEKAGRERFGRQVTLAAAQGRGLAEGFEASLRRFEQAERERKAAAAGRNDMQPPRDEGFAAPELADRAAPPPKLTRQQRRAAERAREKAARAAKAAKAG
jgi:hypothetical protein